MTAPAEPHYACDLILAELQKAPTGVLREDLEERVGVGVEDFGTALAQLEEAGAFRSYGDAAAMYHQYVEPSERRPRPSGIPGTVYRADEEAEEAAAEAARPKPERPDPGGSPAAAAAYLELSTSNPLALLAAEIARTPGARLEVRAEVRFVQGEDGSRAITDVLRVKGVDVVRGD